MELANCSLALGGDNGNTIMKFDVTPSEVAVLQLIHGNDAVTEIEITREEHRTGRNERERLSQNYGKSEEGTFRARAVDQLFPGAAARLFETFEELGLDESFFKAERMAPRKSAKDPLDHDGDGRKGGAAKPASGTTDVLAGMSLPKLLEHATANNIDLGDAKKKPDVLVAIRAHEAAAAAAAAAADEDADGTDGAEGDGGDGAADDDGIGDINDGTSTIFK